MKKAKLNELERFGLELFKRNHDCPVFDGINEGNLDDELENRLFDELIVIKVIPTGIGSKKIVTCMACGEAHDITDYSVW